MDSQDAPADRRDSRKDMNGSVARVESRQEANNKLTLWAAIKKWRRVVYYCAALTSAILLYGYDYAVVSTTSAMPSFQRDFGRKYNGKWILPSLWLGLWSFISPGSAIIGSFVSGYLQDRIGRKHALASGSFLSAIGVAICFVSNLPMEIDQRRGTFLAGKGFQGLAIGIVTTTTQTYMSEILPTILRAPILAFFPIFILIGELVGAGVVFGCKNKPEGYKNVLASQWPFSAIPLIVAVFMPESPTYLVRKGKLDLAYASQKKLDGQDEDTQQTIATIQHNIELEQRKAKATYIDCFRHGNLRRSMIVVFAAQMPQFFGLTLLAKSSYFLQIIGMDASGSLLFLILGTSFGIIANICSIPILHRVGRRPLIIYGYVITAVLWFTMGIAGIWDGHPTVIYSAFAMTAIIVSAGLSVWPASYAVGSEASSLDLRGKAQGIGWLSMSALTALLGFALPYVFNPDAGNLKGKTGFIYAGASAMGSILSYFCVPEMKGRSAAEIDKMFDAKLPARGFGKWTSEEDTEVMVA